VALQASPGTGDCAFDINHPDNRQYKTGYTSGVANATRLIAMYVPCTSLEQARAGSAGPLPWLPEWVTVEANRILVDEEQHADPLTTVATLCRQARVGHPAPIAPDFDAMVLKGHAALDGKTPVVHFGVIGEEPGVCFLGSLRTEMGPAGIEGRFLTVTAFMVAARQWVYHSVRRHSVPTNPASPILQQAQASARTFLAANRCDALSPCPRSP
jgi:hypothetical protein